MPQSDRYASDETDHALSAIPADGEEIGIPPALARRIGEALAACGRTGETVAMQQRLIESLSNETAELRTLLARREGALFRRTLLAVALLVGAAFAWTAREAAHAEAQSAARDGFDERLRAIEAQRRETLTGELDAQRTAFERRQQQRDETSREAAAREAARLARDHEIALAKVIEDKNAVIARREAALKAAAETDRKLEAVRADLRAALAKAAEAEARAAEREKSGAEWQRRALAAEARRPAGDPAPKASVPPPPPPPAGSPPLPPPAS